MIVTTKLLPAATLNNQYSTYIEITGGTTPYSVALISGSLPPGLSLVSGGQIGGIPTQLGLYNFSIEVSDSSSPTKSTAIIVYQLTVLDLIDLSNLTVDQLQFVTQLQQALAKTNTWSTGITTQTSQTLIELISAIGTFATAKINRVKEDAFPETAQSDSAILAIANMQGLRLARMMPATVIATIVSSIDISIPQYTQFSGAGYSWFNSEHIPLSANVPSTVVLKEGTVVSTFINGLGSDMQTWVSVDSDFTVSDQDVLVTLNGAQLHKSFGGLWNFPTANAGGASVLAYADRTLSDGRLLLQFGANGYGAVPGSNDVVGITYAKTNGATINSVLTSGTAFTATSLPTVTGKFTSNPSGGSDKKSTVAYKNFSASTFGTFSSAVTRSQYQSVINNYPGIVDAITQSQREINPSALEWMNVIRVSALTSSPWGQPQKDAFLKYVESTTMFSTHFVWQEPQSIVVNIDVSVYCFNSVTSLATVTATVKAAITGLFAARPGLLMTDFYLSDLTDTVMDSMPGQISHVVINKPTHSMMVTTPSSPIIEYTVNDGDGMLTPMVYNYSVSADAPSPNENFVSLIDATNLTYFPSAAYAGEYWIVSRPGYLTDSVDSTLRVHVTIGDQVKAKGPGNTINNFTIIGMDTNGVIDSGVPSNWVHPQVMNSGSSVTLDWTRYKLENAIRYIVWGRVGGAIGVIAIVYSDMTQMADTGNFTPDVTPISAFSSTAIRYNKIGTLNVTSAYSTRQSGIFYPGRDIV